MTTNNLPNAEIKKDRSISPLWILPLLSLALAAWLVYGAINEAGTRIMIQFDTAQGLVPGRTPIRYKGLEIGMVRKVELADNLSGITVFADIYPKAQNTLSQDTEFWLVSPQASLEGISGLDALVAGNYIAIMPGESRESATEFVALKSAPVDASHIDGLPISLTSPTLNGLSVGSKIYYRRIPVGEVTNYALSSDSQSVQVNAVIRAPYESLVKTSSRFWNISGLQTQIGFDGVDIQMEGLSTLILGGIAFDSPLDGELAEENRHFRLYDSINMAGRGTEIQIILPEDNQMSQRGSAIVYKGLSIGEVTQISLDDNQEQIIATGLIEPAFHHLLTQNSRFSIEQASISLSGVKNLGNLITGNYLRLIPADGEPSQMFTATTESSYFINDSNNTRVTLFSEASFGMSPGVTVRHRGIDVGQIAEVRLEDERVRTELVIDHKYAHLIKSDNRFYVDSGFQAELSTEGVTVDILPFKRLVRESLSFTSDGNTTPAKQYPLYQSKQAARIASGNAEGHKRFTLIHEKKPGIEIGSAVLYKDIKVGKVAEYQLKGDFVVIGIDISNNFTYLVNKHTVFWNYSGISVDAGLTGFSIETGPLSTMVNGGIAFHEQAGIDNKLKGHFRLFDNERAASRTGTIITLRADDAGAISKTTPIRYRGVTVGQVRQTIPDFEQQDVIVEANIYPEYVHTITQSDSYFWVVKPKLSLTQSENLESLLTTYIAVDPGSTRQKATKFALFTEPKGSQGMQLTLQSPMSYDLTEGAPVLFRQMQVGEVNTVSLGELADRVDVRITIYSPYRHLVRKNTVFWNQSGVEFNLGFTGASVEAGTLDSILKGGISFATPPAPLQARASSNTPFLLHASPLPEWKNWRTAIPR
ncbi:PqiB family protein [Thaumasiovibrio subtropicus]|uniref:PqiB family protein n=1 Tax=Thaumasiovibrio subtropicus TaxID=1891207 RepID=UPI000B351044|nr:MlaD family protein [Thaumasiovibrio subtropicus]